MDGFGASSSAKAWDFGRKLLNSLGFDVLLIFAKQLMALMAQVIRLYLVPGARRRRRQFEYFIANRGTYSGKLLPVPDVLKVSPRVICVSGLNPGRFTLQGTNTYVVGTGAIRALVDTSDGNASYMSSLRGVLASEKASLSDVILTHEHFDHVGGLKEIRNLFPGIRVWKHLKSDLEVDLWGNSYSGDLTDGSVVAVEGATLRTILTPGHTSDHLCLALEEEGSIFSGDCVLGSGTAVFENLHDHMGSLRVLLRELETFRRRAAEDSHTHLGKLYPGHGHTEDFGIKRVEATIHHRVLREEEILEFLRKNPTASVDEIVDEIYNGVSLSWLTKYFAKKGVRQHLDKLRREGRLAEG